MSAVRTTVGSEQEYFLVDQELYNRRPDLIYTGRTLFGAKAPKGQELEDHYFGSIKPRVKEFMEELDDELWRLGILAKTEHNEVAPGQHELAPIFTTTNIASDHNQLTMELMQKIARRHDMVCLLHEKPSPGQRLGQAQHGPQPDTGVNLLEPGETPFETRSFCFSSRVIRRWTLSDLLPQSSLGGKRSPLGAMSPPAVLSSIWARS